MITTRQAPLDAAELSARLHALEVPHGRERSFRMTRDEFASDRHLISVAIETLGLSAYEIAAEFADDLAFPVTHRELLRRSFALARFIHFGFEGTRDPRNRVHKLYLEFDLDELEPRPGSLIPVHLAVKWSPALERNP